MSEDSGRANRPVSIMAEIIDFRFELIYGDAIRAHLAANERTCAAYDEAKLLAAITAHFRYLTLNKLDAAHELYVAERADFDRLIEKMTADKTPYLGEEM